MKSQFDPMAATYESFAEHPFRRYVEAPTIASVIGDIKGKKVIDFGCGSGVYTRLLKALGAREVLGFDVSEGMLSTANNIEDSAPVGIRYIDTIDETLYGQFDLVLGVYVLPYNKTKAELFEMMHKMSSLLKPGGRLITLPISPDINQSADYYEKYGFRMLPQSPCADASVFHLELLKQPPIICYYWSRATLYEGLTTSGFLDIEEQYFSKPENSTDYPIAFWNDYISRPHASLMIARRI